MFIQDNAKYIIYLYMYIKWDLLEGLTGCFPVTPIWEVSSYSVHTAECRNLSSIYTQILNK